MKQEVRNKVIAFTPSYYWEPFSRIEDYGLKERITTQISRGL
jgi:hypothetical protein